MVNSLKNKSNYKTSLDSNNLDNYNSLENKLYEIAQDIIELLKKPKKDVNKINILTNVLELNLLKYMDFIDTISTKS